jgi:hypothetical protein
MDNQDPSSTTLSSSLFSADALAVVETAPDYESGLADLTSFYQESKWDDEEQATKILQDSTAALGAKFNEAPHYDYETTKNEIIPIALDEIDEDDPWERVNKWEEVNTRLISEDNSPEILALKPKLLDSIKRAAISERRLLNGKDTLDQKEERDNATTEGEGFFGELGRKFVGGAVGELFGAAGFDETAEQLSAEDPNSSFGRKVAGDVAAGGGYVAGLGVSAAAGAAAGTAVAGPLGTVPGAVIGAVGYNLANAAAAVKRQYETAEEVSGETGVFSRAGAAGATELASQTVQAALGGKAIVGLGRRVLSRSVGTLGAEAGAGAIAGAATGAAGGGISTLAAQIGEDNYSVEGILEGTARGLVAGTVVGGTAAYGGALVGERLRPPADRHGTDTKTIENGELPSSVPAPDGADPIANPTEPKPMPYDGRFFVSDDVAAKVQALKDTVDPEGEKPAIYVNSDGDLVAKSAWLKNDLTYGQMPYDLGEVIIAKKDELQSGTTYVEANRPRAAEDGATQYTSKVTKKSAGAASIEELTQETKAGRRYRTDDSILSKELRELFGDTETIEREVDGEAYQSQPYGLLRYTPVPNSVLTTAVGKILAEKGVPRAIADFLSTPKNLMSTEDSAMGGVLVRMLDEGYRKAKAAGDQLGAEKLSELLLDVAAADSAKGSVAGSVLQARKVGISPAQQVVDLIRNFAREDVHKEVALEENVPVEEVVNTSEQLTKVREEVEALNKVQDPEVVTLDKDLQDTDTLIKEIDDEAAGLLEEAKKADEEKIARAEEEKRQLQKLGEEENAKVDEAIKESEQEAKNLEADFQKRVDKEAEAVQSNIETLQQRIAELEGKAKQTDADRKRVEKVKADLEKTKARPKPTVENLIPDKELKKLAKLKDTVEKAKQKRATGGGEKRASRLADLDNFIKDRKTAIKGRAPESVLPKSRANQKLKLTKTREGLAAQREAAGSRFTAEQQARYKELTGRAKKLSERKAKVAKRIQDKVAEALPEEVRKKLDAYEAALDILPPNSKEAIRLETEIAKIKHEAAKTHKSKIQTFNDLLHTYYYANLLFRGSTQAVNFLANTFMVPMKAAALTATGLGNGRSLTDGLYYMADFLEAAKRSGANEAARAFFEGKETTKTLVESKPPKADGESAAGEVRSYLGEDFEGDLKEYRRKEKELRERSTDKSLTQDERLQASEEAFAIDKKIRNLENIRNYGAGSEKVEPITSKASGARYSGHLAEGLRRAIDSWIVGLELGDLIVLTPSELHHGQFFNKPGNSIHLDRALLELQQHLTFNKRVAGAAVTYGDRQHIVVLKDLGDDYNALKVASHEIGHALWNERVVYALGGNEQLRSAVLRDFERASQIHSKPETSVADAAEAMQGPNRIDPARKVGDLSKERFAYLFEEHPGLDEFVANRVSEYLLNPDKPAGRLLEKFYKGVADTFRKLWNRVKDVFEPSYSLEKWLDVSFDAWRAYPVLKGEEGPPRNLSGVGKRDIFAYNIPQIVSSVSDEGGSAARPTGLEVKDRVTVGYPDPVELLSSAKKVGPVLKYLGYSLRALSAGDAIFTRSGYEAEAANIVRVEGRRAGKTGEALRNYVAEQLFNSESDWQSALKEAEGRSKILKDVGIEMSDRDLISNAWAIMDQKRRSDVRAHAAYAAGISWLNPDVKPRGYMGALSNLIARAALIDLPIGGGRKIERPAALIQPFLNTTLKVANLTIDATPLGFAKAFIGSRGAVDPITGKFTGNVEPGNVLRTQLGSAIVGTTTMALLYGALRAQKDDQDPWFDIIGPVPKTNEGKATFFGAGKKPWSIKLGDKYISFVYTPLVGPLGSVALLNHKLKYDKNFKEKDGLDVVGTLMLGSFRAFSDLAVLRTATGLFEAISTGEDRYGAIENSLAGTVRGLAFPGVTILEEIDRAFNNPTSTKGSFMAKVLRATPMASLAGNPQLNLWGEPVERNWMERLPIAGSMAGRFVGLETDDPDFLWLINNGYNIAGIENKVRIQSEDPGLKPIKDLRKANFGAIYDDVLTEQENYELQKRVGPLYKATVQKYRIAYGDHGYMPQIEEALKEELSQIKTAAKYQLFIAGALGSQPK